jgi:DNA-binding NarL/FixJ family response regulator
LHGAGSPAWPAGADQKLEERDRCARYKGFRSPIIVNQMWTTAPINMNAPQFYPKLQEEFQRLHGLGWTYHQIAEALDVSQRTLTKRACQIGPGASTKRQEASWKRR